APVERHGPSVGGPALPAVDADRYHRQNSTADGIAHPLEDPAGMGSANNCGEGSAWTGDMAEPPASSCTAVVRAWGSPALIEAAAVFSSPLAMAKPIHIIGGGLAGSEAAWQVACAGVSAIVHEMRPLRMTEAHKTAGLAELVCSNSFRSDDKAANAVGLLHE